MNTDNKKEQTEQCTMPSVIGSYVFDRELLLKAMNEKVDHFIGIDTYDKNINAYCLTKLQNKETTVLLADIIRDEDEFKETVENLAKYFNAKVLGE